MPLLSIRVHVFSQCTPTTTKISRVGWRTMYTPKIRTWNRDNSNGVYLVLGKSSRPRCNKYRHVLFTYLRCVRIWGHWNYGDFGELRFPAKARCESLRAIPARIELHFSPSSGGKTYFRHVTKISSSSSRRFHSGLRNCSPSVAGYQCRYQLRGAE